MCIRFCIGLPCASGELLRPDGYDLSIKLITRQSKNRMTTSGGQMIKTLPLSLSWCLLRA